MGYYHISQHRFRVGELVVPSLRRGQVFLTNAPTPHYTMIEIIDRTSWTWPADEYKRPRRWDARGWYCYEVRPIGDVNRGDCWDEWYCDAAEVVRCLGNANGILKNSKPNWRTKAHGEGIRGSAVRRPRDGRN